MHSPSSNSGKITIVEVNKTSYNNHRLKKYIQTIIILVSIVGAVFYFRGPIENFLAPLENQYLPCYRPIAYSIGSFDSRFGISKESFLKTVATAEAIWEKPINKELFVYTPDGSLKINLIYDIRQEATSKLAKLGLVVNDDKASFDALLTKYNALKTAYPSDKAILEKRISAFMERKNKYEQDVAGFNKRGRARQGNVTLLEAEREWLSQEILNIRKLQDDFNAKVDEINSLAIVLNSLAKSLNIKMAEFNQVGGVLSGEFEVGTYESGPGGREINIYQFDDREKLIRVLAHELGHALGLDHLENTEAIMYRLNNDVNENLTADDLTSLKKLCGVK